MVEISLNASSQMDGIAKEWGFASRSAYSRDIPSIESFSTYIGNSFTRTEKLQTQTGNDSMKFNIQWNLSIFICSKSFSKLYFG